MRLLDSCASGSISGGIYFRFGYFSTVSLRFWLHFFLLHVFLPKKKRAGRIAPTRLRSLQSAAATAALNLVSLYREPLRSPFKFFVHPGCTNCCFPLFVF